MRIPVYLIKFLSFLYLSNCLIPFFIFWLKTPLAIIFLLIYGIGAWLFLKSLDLKARYSVSWLELIWSSIVLLFWLSLSGAGGMGVQYADMYKFNSIFEDLIKNPWPLSYEVNGEQYYFTHYLGFFLPPAAYAGFLGYRETQLFSFFYTVLGVFLGFFWIARYLKMNWIKTAVLFIIFGGIYQLSFLMKYQQGFLTEMWQRIMTHNFLFWMNGLEVLPINYIPISNMLYWTPQHFITALLGIGLILNDGFVDKNIKSTPFLLSFLFMWSPLVCIGLVPFLVFVVFRNKFKGIWNLLNLVIAPLLLILMFVYFKSLQTENLTKHFILEASNDPLWEKAGAFLYFLIFEVLIWAIPIYFVLNKRKKDFDKSLFLITVVFLMIIPLYRFGLWNDWCTRVSMVPLIVLALFAIKAATLSIGKWKLVFFLLFALGSYGSLIDILGSLKGNGYVIKFDPPDENRTGTLIEVCEGHGFPLDQFLAKKDSFFYKHLAKTE